MLRLDRPLVAAENRRALDDVAQLPYVARPTVRVQRLERRRRKHLDPAVLTHRLRETLSRDQRDVVLALAKRRHRDREDVQAVEQVFAERAGAHRVLQQRIGGCDETALDVHFVRAAQQTHAPRFENAQQLGLQRDRHLVDLVEEERAGAGQLEQSTLPLLGVGERPAFVAEQLGLQQRLGDRRTVHGHEGLLRAGPGIMDPAREELLAGAGLAEQKHRRSRRPGHPPRQLQRLGDRRAAPDDVLEAEVGRQRPRRRACGVAHVVSPSDAPLERLPERRRRACKPLVMV